MKLHLSRNVMIEIDLLRKESRWLSAAMCVFGNMILFDSIILLYVLFIALNYFQP